MLGVELEASVLESSPRRRRRSRAERRRVVEETLEPGSSVARVARKYGVNANQVFQWRRLYHAGRLGEPSAEVKLLPVRVAEPEQHALGDEHAAASACSGAIHIELPGRAVISVEGCVDQSLVRAVLECLVP
jgi:transposase